MSHFTVLVITSEQPTDAVLQRELLPFHEYECTGIEQYLEEVDVTDQVLKYFNEEARVVVLADNSYHSRWDDKFRTKLSDDEFDRRAGRKEFELPVGAFEKTISADEARTHNLGPLTMKQAALDNFGEGIIERDGKFYRRTNPNAKWDWYARGGRWRGMLLQKPEAALSAVSVGTPGAFGNDKMREGGVDSLQVRSLDLVGMQNDAVKKAAARYDQAAAVLNGTFFESWEQVKARYEGALDAAREFYNTQPGIRALREAKIQEAYFEPDQFLASREAYLEEARLGAFQTFAILKGGKWYERGSMGWWGAVSDEKDKDNWSAEFTKLVENLSPEAWLTVVDCHI